MAAVGALITAVTHSRAVLAKAKHVELGSRVVGDAAGASPSSQCHPESSQLTCPRLCCQHQPEPGSFSQPPHQPPCLAGVQTLPLPLPAVYEDAKSSLRLACAAFPEKKVDINSSQRL